MLRPLIVGQAPSASSDPAEPLSGRSGRRLASLCCLSLEEFIASYDRANLVGEFPGRLQKGDAFPIGPARASAVLIRGGLSPRRLVLLGSGVARAFGVPAGSPALRWFALGRHRAAICPHPSGVCQFWNDPRNVGQARSFWLELETARRRALTTTHRWALRDHVDDYVRLGWTALPTLEGTLHATWRVHVVWTCSCPPREPAAARRPESPPRRAAS